jgi:hypothetical protein
MKYIANIITKSKIDVGEYIKVTKDITEVDLNIPTLIVGWAVVKEFYPNANILDKHITDTISWTYSNREKRQEYEPDLAKFIKNAFEKLSTSVSYTFFNILTSRLNRVKSLINYINSDKTKVIYLSDKNGYLYDGKQVIGISLSDLDYIGIKRDKILKLITKQHKNIIVFNDTFLSWKIKRVIDGNDKVIPFLYSIKEDVFF